MIRTILLAITLLSNLQAAFSLISTTFAGVSATGQTLAGTLTQNTQAGDLIVGTVGGEGATCVTVTIPAVSDQQGTNYSMILKQLGTSNEVSWAFYGTPATSGSNQVTVDFGSGHSCLNRAFYIQEWSGVKSGAGALDASSSFGEAVGSTAITSHSTVPQQKTVELMICQARAFSITRTFTAGTSLGIPWNIAAQQNTVGSSVAASAISTTTGGYACLMTINSSAQWTAHILTFLPAEASVKHRVTGPD